MKHELLYKNLCKHVKISKKEFDHVLKQLRPKLLKKKQFLLKEKEIAKDAAFVLSGCLRSYSVDQNGFEHVLQFAPADWWMTDMYSFITEQAGHLNIEAVSDTEVLLLSRKDQTRLFDELPQLERYFRILTEKSLVASRERLIDNMSQSAKERYANFCTIYPTLIHDLPQKQIAAFIGLTPEFLSKLKSEMLRSRLTK
jgi:CRP/FNR family transcriptional regulator, anaerobic regulatory protein